MQRQMMMQQFKTWWEPLALREKRMLLAGAVSLAVVLFYVCVLSPLHHRVTTMRQQVVSNQKTLQFMRAAQKELGLTQDVTKVSVMSPVEFLSDLQQRLTQAGVMSSVTELKQTSDATIDLSLHQVAFDRVMRLLAELTRDVAVSIEQFTAAATDSPGVVDMRLQFKLKS